MWTDDEGSEMDTEEHDSEHLLSMIRNLEQGNNTSRNYCIYEIKLPLIITEDAPCDEGTTQIVDSDDDNKEEHYYVTEDAQCEEESEEDDCYDDGFDDVQHSPKDKPNIVHHHFADGCVQDLSPCNRCPDTIKEVKPKRHSDSSIAQRALRLDLMAMVVSTL